MLFGVILTARPQETRTAFSVRFRAGSAEVDPAFGKNAAQLAAIADFFDGIGRDAAVEISSISFCGSASPEGSYQLNRELSRKRLTALEQFVRGRVQLSEGLIARDDTYIPWEELKRVVSLSDLPQKDAILAIIDHTPRQVPYAGGATIDERVLQLKRLEGGRVWQELHDRYFNALRSACVIIVGLRREPAPVQPAPEPAKPAEPAEPAAAPVAAAPAPTPEPTPEPFMPRVLVKTNLIGWGLSMANLAVEVDLCRHLSFALPVYYSGMNYFSHDLKFRIFGFQPELRYWFCDRNDGWFVGGHFGMAWYDFAFKGPHRYQDHHRNTPALGGGASVGYRLPIGRRWRVEFAVGGGAYRAHYDCFDNEPDGPLVESRKKTYIGLDNVSIAFGYTFNMKKGGAK